MFYVEVKSTLRDLWERLPDTFSTFAEADDFAYEFTDESGSYSQVLDEAGVVMSDH